MTKVVYCLPKPNNKGYCYEFTTVGGTDNIQTPLQVTVYHELDYETMIPSLREPNTYFIVDPGQTNVCCNSPDAFMAKVIIVTSPTKSIHWGITLSKFCKRRGWNSGGLSIYMAVWNYNELECARSVFSSKSNIMTKDVLRKRYNEVGGVPLQLFLQ